MKFIFLQLQTRVSGLQHHIVERPSTTSMSAQYSLLELLSILLLLTVSSPQAGSRNRLTYRTVDAGAAYIDAVAMCIDGVATCIATPVAVATCIATPDAATVFIDDVAVCIAMPDYVASERSTRWLHSLSLLDKRLCPEKKFCIASM